MRAMSWFFFTGELKSTKRSLIWPETCEPTCTETTGFTVPVAETTAVIEPRSSFARRYAGGDLKGSFHQTYAPPAAANTASAPTTYRDRLFIRAAVISGCADSSR